MSMSMGMDVVSWVTASKKIRLVYEAFCQPVCRVHGLSQTEFDVMAFLMNHPGYDTARDICELRLLKKANVSVAIDKLIRRELLTKRPDVQDRRLMRLQLTAEAQPILAEIRAVQLQFDGCVKRCMTPEEIAENGRLMKKFMNRIMEIGREMQVDGFTADEVPASGDEDECSLHDEPRPHHGA